MTKKEVKKKNNIVQIVLIVLLAGATFAMGSMWSELKTLKKSASPAARKEAAPEAEVKKEEAVLSDELWAELMSKPAAVKGKEGAKLTIVELSDYQCPFCKRYNDQTLQQIMKEYVETGKARYLIRDLPLAFHQNAQKAAEAARCAGDQGKYWEMHDKLFLEQSSWSEAKDTSLFKDYAGELGLDQARFANCLDEGKMAEAVKADLELAGRTGASGTPTFFINKKKLVGAQPFEAFKALIEAELE